MCFNVNFTMNCRKLNFNLFLSNVLVQVCLTVTPPRVSTHHTLPLRETCSSDFNIHSIMTKDMFNYLPSVSFASMIGTASSSFARSYPYLRFQVPDCSSYKTLSFFFFCMPEKQHSKVRLVKIGQQTKPQIRQPKQCEKRRH